MQPPLKTGGDGDVNVMGSLHMLNLLVESDNIVTPASKNKMVQNLVYSEKDNIVNVPLANSNTNAGGEGDTSTCRRCIF